MQKTILVIEDDESMQEILSILLKRENYIVLRADDGNEALEKIKQQIPDLIICDYYLPYLNGLEILKILREKDLTANIPFIFLTGSIIYDLKEKIGKDMNVSHYLKKPVDKKELISTVQKAFL